MNARSFAASVLLVAATFCVTRVTWDGIGHHIPLGLSRPTGSVPQQCRPSGHHLTSSRPPGPIPAVTVERTSAPMAPRVAGRTSLVEPQESLPPFLPPVFVPPRA